MGIFDKLNTSADSQVEESWYEEVAIEELEDVVKKGEIWAKALERSKGDEAKARELYIAYRIQSMKDETRVEELKAQSIMDSMKSEETYLFNECTKILERKGYVLKVDGAHSFTINCLNSTSPNNLNLTVKARATSLPELYKLARECNKTKAKRKKWYLVAITPSVVVFGLLGVSLGSNSSGNWGLFFLSLIIIVAAFYLVFDDKDFIVSDKKDEPETDSLHKVTTDTIWKKINRALTTF